MDRREIPFYPFATKSIQCGNTHTIAGLLSVVEFCCVLVADSEETHVVENMESLWLGIANAFLFVVWSTILYNSARSLRGYDKSGEINTVAHLCAIIGLAVLNIALWFVGYTYPSLHTTTVGWMMAT